MGIGAAAFAGIAVFSRFLDAQQHDRVERAEKEFDVADLRVFEFCLERREFGRHPRVEPAVFGPHRQDHQLVVQVVQVGDQVQRVFEVALLLLALLAQQVHDIHIPEENFLFLLFGKSERLHEFRINRFGAELQCAQQVFQLPEVEDVFGDILFAGLLCGIHGGLRLIRCGPAGNVSCPGCGMPAGGAVKGQWR